MREALHYDLQNQFRWREVFLQSEKVHKNRTLASVLILRGGEEEPGQAKEARRKRQRLGKGNV